MTVAEAVTNLMFAKISCLEVCKVEHVFTMILFYKGLFTQSGFYTSS